MDEHQCKDCQYFMQYYTLGNDRIFRVCCGYCIYSRTKRKRPDSKSCGNFTPGQPQEDGFVSKEYLSKKLLERLLSLELLPEIEDRG